MPVTGSNLSKYSLSIRISADGFSFFVNAPLNGELIHREDYTLHEGESMSHKLGNMLVQPTMQDLTYDKVQVIVDSPSTLIPEEEFNANEVENCYGCVFSDVDIHTHRVCSTPLPSLFVVVLFSLPHDVYDTITNLMPQATFTSVFATTLSSFADYSTKHDFAEPPLFVYLQPNQMLLYSVFRGKLLFANSFSTDNIQNTLYFLLSVWKILKFDARVNHCIISGDDTTLTTSLADELGEFLQYVELV